MMYVCRWVVWINIYLPCDRRKLDGFTPNLRPQEISILKIINTSVSHHAGTTNIKTTIDRDALSKLTNPTQNPLAPTHPSHIPYPISQPTKHNQPTMCFGRSKAEKSYQQGYQQGVSQGMANSNRMGGGSSSSGGGLMSKLMGGSRARHQAQPVTMTSSAGGMSHSGGGLMGGSSGIGGGRHTTGGVLGGGSGIGGGRHTAGAMGSGPGFGGTSGRAGGGRFGRSSGGRSRF
jgi:hypothetical protein